MRMMAAYGSVARAEHYRLYQYAIDCLIYVDFDCRHDVVVVTFCSLPPRRYASAAAMRRDTPDDYCRHDTPYAFATPLCHSAFADIYAPLRCCRLRYARPLSPLKIFTLMPMP